MENDNQAEQGRFTFNDIAIFTMAATLMRTQSQKSYPFESEPSFSAQEVPIFFMSVEHQVSLLTVFDRYLI